MASALCSAPEEETPSGSSRAKMWASGALKKTAHNVNEHEVKASWLRRVSTAAEEIIHTLNCVLNANRRPSHTLEHIKTRLIHSFFTFSLNFTLLHKLFWFLNDVLKDAEYTVWPGAFSTTRRAVAEECFCFLWGDIILICSLSYTSELNLGM